MRRTANRREFLGAAPLALAVGFSLTDTRSLAAETSGSFQVFRAAALTEDAKALEEKPGNNNLVTEKSFTVVMTVETAKSAKEFEWHEGRDHVVQILAGETVYEVGGKPLGSRSTGPGEWKSAEADGAMMLTLKKGDMLTVPRGTLHKRSTAGSVTFLLISSQGTV